MSYKIGPTAATLPTRLAFSHIFPRTSGPLTVICACLSPQTSSLRVVRVFDFLRSGGHRFFRLEGGLPLSVAVIPGLSGLVSPLEEMPLAFEVVSFWTDIAWTAIWPGLDSYRALLIRPSSSRSHIVHTAIVPLIWGKAVWSDVGAGFDCMTAPILLGGRCSRATTCFPLHKACRQSIFTDNNTLPS
jgi:hypothetical protein